MSDVQHAEDDTMSDYDPLFDDGDTAFVDNGESQVIHGMTLALPRYTGPPLEGGSSAPMRSVENVGTIAPSASPSIFSKSPSPTLPLISADVVRKRNRDMVDSSEVDILEPPRSRPRRPHGPPYFLQRPKQDLLNKLLDRKTFFERLPIFLSNDADLLGALRSYIHLLTNPLAHETRNYSPQSLLVAPRKRKIKVPANADDWDIPFPFAEGEAPEGYYERWFERKVKLFSGILASAVRRAIVKNETMELAASPTPPVVAPQRDVDLRAFDAATCVSKWFGEILFEQAHAIHVDLLSVSEPSSSRTRDPFDAPLSVGELTTVISKCISGTQRRLLEDNTCSHRSISEPAQRHDSPMDLQLDDVLSAPSDAGSAYHNSPFEHPSLLWESTPSSSSISSMNTTGEPHIPSTLQNSSSVMSLFYSEHESASPLPVDMEIDATLFNISSHLHQQKSTSPKSRMHTLNTGEEAFGLSTTGASSGSPGGVCTTLPHSTVMCSSQSTSTTTALPPPSSGAAITKTQTRKLKRPPPIGPVPAVPIVAHGRTLVVTEVCEKATVAQRRIKDELGRIQHELCALEIERLVLEELKLI